MIRVLLVDDSPTVLAVLTRMLSGVEDIEVAATAANGREALEAIARCDPTVVVTDLYMPVMDGLELTRRIMRGCPRPVLALSVAVREPDSPQAFQALEAGAVDLFPKPAADELASRRQELIRKIRILAGVRVIRRMSSTPLRKEANGTEPAGTAALVVIGASTGGPQALQALLSQLPADYSVPVACVQHISPGFLEGMVDWLRGRCAVEVTILREPQRPRGGCVYFPMEDSHLVVDRRRGLVLSSSPPVSGHRPSITVAMASAAEAHGAAGVGVLLTGMGEDGVEGMRRIYEAGGLTVAQDQASCVVYGMPARAVERGVARRQLAPLAIGRLLARLKGG